MTTAVVAIRPKQKRMSGGARRRQILDVGMGVFSRKGYSGATTKAIARAVGVSEAILFRHFASKEALYTAILDDLMPKSLVNTFLQQARQLGESRADCRLFAMVAAGFLWCHREEKTLNRLLMRAAVEGHELARPIHLRTVVPIIRFLREYITRRQAEGAFPVVDAEPNALALVGLPIVVGYWRDLFGYDAVSIPDDELALRFAEMLLTTLAKRPETLSREARRGAREAPRSLLQQPNRAASAAKSPRPDRRKRRR